MPAEGGAAAAPGQVPGDRDLNACHLLDYEEVGALAGVKVAMRDQTEASDRPSKT